MAALQQAVRAICLLLLLDSLLQMLFPRGSWQGTLRLISGLLMAVLLLQPLAALGRGEPALPLPFAAAEEVTTQRAQQNGAQLLAALSASAGQQQQRQLADQAAALARLSSGADAVDSWWEGEVLHIELSAAAVDAVQLRDDIAFLLQIGQENIEVSINGGSE